MVKLHIWIPEHGLGAIKEAKKLGTVDIVGSSKDRTIHSFLKIIL
jgi:hypothetical protein